MQAMSAIALPNGNVGHFRRRPEKFQRILTYMEKVLFAAAFFVAYTIQAVTGFAGNIFAMPVGTHVMGLSSSVAVLNAMGFFACGMLAVLNFKHINWRELAKMTCGMLPFLALGIWLDTVLPLPVLLRIYGAIIVFIGIRNLLSKEQRFLPKWLLAIIVAAATKPAGSVARIMPRTQATVSSALERVSTASRPRSTQQAITSTGTL